MAAPALVWFRNDLRLADNPALSAAVARGGAVKAIYIEETDPGLRPIGAAARWWLNRSLNALAAGLAANGIELTTARGTAAGCLLAAAREAGADAIFWNRRYAPAERDVDAAIKRQAEGQGIVAQSFAANVLVEPFDIATGAGEPYAVFTPFWRTLRQRDIPVPLPAPAHGNAIKAPEVDTDYEPPGWSRKLEPHWIVGEAAARAALDRFLDERLPNYPEGRDFAARDVTSRLSPHLRFGEISPRQVWHAATALAHRSEAGSAAIDKFLSELAWRDFHYHQLYHREDIASVPMQQKFTALQWRQSPADLAVWQKGETGIPIVDAGMRELWATGTMHNRVRMLTASLLAKNLLLDWRLGEQWFWDCLVDADGASNPGNWQWVAGSGNDASPYFRIFNPVTQGERFDGEGDYVRRWVPELAKMPPKWIHHPADAPEDVLAKAGVVLDKTYPAPMVNLGESRKRALAAFSGL